MTKPLLFCLFFIGLFLQSLPTFALVVNPGDDKTVYEGATTTLGSSPTASEGKEPYTYEWSLEDGTIFSNEANPLIDDVTLGETTYCVSVTDANSITCNLDCITINGVSNNDGIRLRQISFAVDNLIINDLAQGTTYTPKWTDGGTTNPLYYKSGATMEISARLQVDNQSVDLSNFKIKGEIADGFYFESTTVVVTQIQNGLLLTVSDMLANNSFPDNMVNFYDPMLINWQISLDGGNTWQSIGISENRIYVVHDTPNKDVMANGGIPMGLYETLFNIGCKYAKNETIQETIIQKIWEGFETLEVRRADGEQMYYYKDYDANNIEAWQLIYSLDGQCGSWAKLFIDVLKMQGIHNSNNYVTFESSQIYWDDENVFFVKDWSFNNNGTPYNVVLDGINNTIYTHNNIARSNGSYWALWTNEIDKSNYYFFKEEIKDEKGGYGQGKNKNPLATFNNHQVVFIDGIYYDVSYGQTYLSKDDFDMLAIEAHALGENIFLDEEGQEDYNLDGDTNDLQVQCYSLHIRTNTPNAVQADITEIFSNH